MKTIKKCWGLVAELVAYTLIIPTLFGTALPMYEGYKSGFIRNYNQAIVRNGADINLSKQFSLTELEEKKKSDFRKGLLNEVTRLGNQGKDLDQIVEWLETR